MPKNKKLDDSSDSDSSGPRDRTPPAKKSKSEGSSSKSKDKDKDGEDAWDLGKNKTVKITEFKGKLYVDIREYYEKDGKQLPGKKGIALPVDQYRKLKELLPEIDEALKNY